MRLSQEKKRSNFKKQDNKDFTFSDILMDGYNYFTGKKHKLQEDIYNSFAEFKRQQKTEVDKWQVELEKIKREVEKEKEKAEKQKREDESYQNKKNFIWNTITSSLGSFKDTITDTASNVIKFASENPNQIIGGIGALGVGVVGARVGCKKINEYCNDSKSIGCRVGKSTCKLVGVNTDVKIENKEQLVYPMMHPEDHYRIQYPITMIKQPNPKYYQYEYNMNNPINNTNQFQIVQNEVDLNYHKPPEMIEINKLSKNMTVEEINKASFNDSNNKNSDDFEPLIIQSNNVINQPNIELNSAVIDNVGKILDPDNFNERLVEIEYQKKNKIASGKTYKAQAALNIENSNNFDIYNTQPKQSMFGQIMSRVIPSGSVNKPGNETKQINDTIKYETALAALNKSLGQNITGKLGDNSVFKAVSGVIGTSNPIASLAMNAAATQVPMTGTISNYGRGGMGVIGGDGVAGGTGLISGGYGEVSGGSGLFSGGDALMLAGSGAFGGYALLQGGTGLFQGGDGFMFGGDGARGGKGIFGSGKNLWGLFGEWSRRSSYIEDHPYAAALAAGAAGVAVLGYGSSIINATCETIKNQCKNSASWKCSIGNGLCKNSEYKQPAQIPPSEYKINQQNPITVTSVVQPPQYAKPITVNKFSELSIGGGYTPPINTSGFMIHPVKPNPNREIINKAAQNENRQNRYQANYSSDTSYRIPKKKKKNRDYNDQYYDEYYDEYENDREYNRLGNKRRKSKNNMPDIDRNNDRGNINKRQRFFV